MPFEKDVGPGGMCTSPFAREVHDIGTFSVSAGFACGQIEVDPAQGLEAASDGCAEIVGRSQRVLQDLAGFLFDRDASFLRPGFERSGKLIVGIGDCNRHDFWSSRAGFRASVRSTKA